MTRGGRVRGAYVHDGRDRRVNGRGSHTRDASDWPLTDHLPTQGRGARALAGRRRPPGDGLPPRDGPLRRLLEESDDPLQLAEFDLDTWVAGWMREPLPQIGNKTPAEMLRNPEGQRAVELVLERMRGGLPA